MQVETFAFTSAGVIGPWDALDVEWILDFGVTFEPERDRKRKRRGEQERKGEKTGKGGQGDGKHQQGF